MNQNIFKAYDIRGIYPTDLNETDAQKIAAAFADLIKSETEKNQPMIVVSRDMRNSSPQIHQHVKQGIISQGANVIDIGLASTPTYYFAVGFLGADGGMQISASHNPAEYNGLKLVRSQAIPVSGETGIYQLAKMVDSKDFPSVSNPGSVTVKTDILESLIAAQTQGYDLQAIKPFRVVADAANAMGALDLSKLFEILPCELIQVNFELDGSFPSHEADPLKKENLKLLQEKVLEHKADLGISTDGDGDRIFFVADTGELVAPEIIRGILSQMVLRKYPGSNIGYDIRPGKITQDMIEQAGGKPFITRVGHSLIKEEMIKMDSPFSGESSGHFFYKFDTGSYEAPIKVTLDILQWLSDANKPMSQAIQKYQKYFHSGEINFIVEDKQAVFEKLKQKFVDAKKFSDLDGVYFEYDDYWFNVRASNTEPKMRLNLEGVDKSTMKQKVKEVSELIK